MRAWRSGLPEPRKKLPPLHCDCKSGRAKG
nr:MAG TPA: hypothetical protein [Caudoviricetes sp.]